ncbi:hypothetical protein [Halotalea alkalilenta]|uniref:Haem-binding uptake Tiki superfamily ChaN domain-containing protein n=1 Tax=Halotalea alkalilenta TaxID=376489 RepID=A0A172YEL8_9GAMM|nr:hypothetical protein [Halotalea alkalilenta]ANF57415.1 hypothetical protein A5892_08015 [Halotalea alkalilenta]
MARTVTKGFADVASALAGWFDQAGLVGLGEAHLTPKVMRALTELILSEAIASRCQDLVVEFGCQRHQALLDAYLAGSRLGAGALKPIWNDGPHATLWRHPVYAALLRRLRAVNRKRPAQRRMRMWLAEPAGEWPCAERDRHRRKAFLGCIEQRLLASGRPGLLLFGMRHLARSPVDGRVTLASQLLDEGIALRTLWPELPPRLMPFDSACRDLELIDVEGDLAARRVNPWGGETQPLSELCDAVLRVPGARRETRCRGPDTA